VGRGVLLDYAAWAHDNNIQYSPIRYHEITVKDLEAVAKAQGTILKPGDILLIRSGFVSWYMNATGSERLEGSANAREWAGVQGSEETVRWLWNHHFSAVGGDASVFEAWPAKDETWRLHDNLIALLGMPIGEMFDLERLSEECQKARQWSFFFTSAPINFPGGVASPPNAICVL
jgi:kynurenine formamidase